MNEILTAPLISKYCSTEKEKNRERFLYKQSLLFLFCKPLQRTYHVRDHSGTLRSTIGLAMEQSDSSILVLGPLVAQVV